MIHFEKKFLDNELRVIAAPMENTEAVTLLVLVDVGSRHETKNLNGISHFLEHLFFKGTKNRPKPGDIFRELNKIGANYDAFTSKESTGFWIKSSTRDLDVNLDIISDMLLNPLFKNEEIEKERGVILQEINMYEDDPYRKNFNNLENILYGDQPIGWDVIGTKETIKNIKKTDIVKYKNDNYFSKNIVIAIAGNFDKKIIFSKIEKVFKRIKKGTNKPVQKTKVFQRFPHVKIFKKEVDQTHLAIGVNGYSMFDEKRYSLNLLSIILGGNMSSRLFREIRDKRGLAYYIYTFGDQYTDCGYLGMTAGIPNEKTDKVLRIIIKILKNFKEKGVSEKDLDLAKSFTRGQMALSFETSNQIASFLAHQELFYKKILQPEEILKKIEKINQNDILKTAKDIFKSQKINLAIIGPQIKKKEELLKKILLRI